MCEVVVFFPPILYILKQFTFYSWIFYKRVNSWIGLNVLYCRLVVLFGIYSVLFNVISFQVIIKQNLRCSMRSWLKPHLSHRFPNSQSSLNRLLNVQKPCVMPGVICTKHMVFFSFCCFLYMCACMCVYIYMEIYIWKYIYLYPKWLDNSSQLFKSLDPFFGPKILVIFKFNNFARGSGKKRGRLRFPFASGYF